MRSCNHRFLLLKLQIIFFILDAKMLRWMSEDLWWNLWAWFIYLCVIEIMQSVWFSSLRFKFTISIEILTSRNCPLFKNHWVFNKFWIAVRKGAFDTVLGRLDTLWLICISCRNTVVTQDFLSVRTDLSTNTCSYMFSNFFPIFIIKFDC